MKGIVTSVSSIRKMIFTEVARLAYSYDGGRIDDLNSIPYKIIPGETSTYRESVFLERAIVAERLRLAMGLPLRSASEQGPVSEGAEECTKPETYYTPPLVNVIKFACNSCPDNVVHVTDICQGCLSHPCREVCPKGAISVKDGKSVIDQEKCIKCGKCVSACPYHAIIRQERPCASACGMKAIRSDKYGRADIDYSKCVSCGQCLVNCPFGAIADKSQIFQCIQAIKSGTPVVAAIAPSIVGQFGADYPPEKLRSALKALGFAHVIEVAIGADICAVDETRKYVEEVPEKIPFMATSCCPAWIEMIKRLYPSLEDCISMSLTPMVLTARFIKRKHPQSRVVFIGPCAAKKLEAIREDIRSDVDFVLTYEEVAGMLEAKGVDPAKLESAEYQHGASADGRGFAVSGGVAAAVKNSMAKLYPEVEPKMAFAEGLDNCKKLAALAKAGKYNGYIIEGMACPGGCVAGAGTLQPVNKSAAAIEAQKKASKRVYSFESRYTDLVEELENLDI